MTATPRKSSSPDGRRTGGFTGLERVVMEALARELRDQAPDLAAQFAASRLTVRRNSGFGVFTEMLAPAQRRPGGPSGDLGRVHVMLPGLTDPVAFRVRLRDGRLMGLLGDSYGQDTRAIDFDNIRFTQAFTLDDRGRSIPLDPVGAADPVAPPPPRFAPPSAAPATVYVEPRSPPAAPSPRPAPEPGPPPHASPDAPLSDEEKTTLRVGLWGALFAVGSVLVIIFEAPIPFVFIAAFIVGRYLQTDRGLLLVRRVFASLQQAARREPA